MLRRLEGAVAVAEQDTHYTAKIIGFTCYRQVEPTVAVEISYRHSLEVEESRGKALGGLEGAVAIAQQHADRAVSICRHQVELAVAVEVPDRHRESRRTDAVTLRRLECAVAIAQEDSHPAVGMVGSSPVVGEGEVGDAVAVEIAHRHGLRIGTRRVLGRRDKTCHEALP